MASMRRMEFPFIPRIRGPFPGLGHMYRITRILYSTKAATIKSYGSGLIYRVRGVWPDAPVRRSRLPPAALVVSIQGSDDAQIFSY